MFQTNCCNCRCACTAGALIISAILGVLAAFLQITGVITVAPVFLWVSFGIAVVYLGILTAASIPARCSEPTRCKCAALRTLLIGILGTILLAVILLAVGIIATSIISAILIGLLVFFLGLTFTSTACYVRSLTECGE